jgi:formylglycine-generating enzyme required for sulfatase activity
VGQPWPLHGFREVTLAPFDEAQRDTFVTTWYAELAHQGRLDAAEARARARQLQTALRRCDLAGLARRPLLLTVMALLHSFRGQLPEDRTELYADAVDLLLRRWERRVGQEAGLLEQLALPGLKVSDLEAGLYEVAFRAHGAAGEAQGTADIEERDLRQWLAPYLGGSWDKAGDFVTYVRERAGLLVRHKSAAYTFPHRTFQEFLAACHLVGRADYVTVAAQLARDDPARWREVFILAAGHAARTHRLGLATAAVNALCPVELAHAAEPTADDYLAVQLAGEALQEIGLLGVQREAVGQALLARVRRWLVAGLRADAVLEPRQRAAVGDVLAELGDPRFRADAWYLPDEPLLGFVEIPAGPFVMGSDPERDRYTRESEQPQHERTLSTYYMAHYPITLAQFRTFVHLECYVPATERCLSGLDTHPVAYVTWHDAVAYCRWLTERLRVWEGTPEPLASLLREQGWEIGLPSEVQWEKAARGTDERIYPWGNDPEPNRANYAETGLGTTSAVGCFPGGASPYEVEDLSGNVWEWCKTEWQERYEDYRADLEAENNAMLRGGAFYDFERYIRCVVRNWDLLNDRDARLGFRVVCSAPK